MMDTRVANRILKKLGKFTTAVNSHVELLGKDGTLHIRHVDGKHGVEYRFEHCTHEDFHACVNPLELAKCVTYIKASPIFTHEGDKLMLTAGYGKRNISMRALGIKEGKEYICRTWDEFIGDAGDGVETRIAESEAVFSETFDEEVWDNLRKLLPFTSTDIARPFMHNPMFFGGDETHSGLVTTDGCRLAIYPVFKGKYDKDFNASIPLPEVEMFPKESCQYTIYDKRGNSCVLYRTHKIESGSFTYYTFTDTRRLPSVGRVIPDLHAYNTLVFPAKEMQEFLALRPKGWGSILIEMDEGKVSVHIGKQYSTVLKAAVNTEEKVKLYNNPDYILDLIKTGLNIIDFELPTPKPGMDYAEIVTPYRAEGADTSIFVIGMPMRPSDD